MDREGGMLSSRFFFDSNEVNMNKRLTSMITAMLVFLSGPALAETASDETAAPQQQQLVPAEQAPPAAPAETAKAPAPEKAPEPITGAFGLELGKRFEPSMVAKVMDQQEQGYRGPDGAELKGSLIQVEPSQPDKRFQRYSVKTTDKGIIYAIQAEYQFEREQKDQKQEKAGQDKTKQTGSLRKTCKTALKELGKEMEARYGKPRGRDMSGEWYAFRQFSETEDKSLRLYGNRCRSGIYSVVYTDQVLLGIQAKPKKQPQEQDKEKQQEQKQEQDQQQVQDPEPQS
jgi:hypothetical protein